MKPQSQSKRPLGKGHKPKPVAPKAAAPKTARASLRKANPFLAALKVCAEPQKVNVSLRRSVRKVPRFEASLPDPFSHGILARVWSWLQTKYGRSSNKQLRVTETVLLGEKRFVAILHAEGCRYLIGGGASGVSLLKQLGRAPKAGGALQSGIGLTEYSE